jgi:hydroxyethylthiazole kinase-like uncharacterized protein yjeF
MQRITSHTVADLHDIATTRCIERTLAATLPAHALMQRAGLAVARLAMALAPHARTIWIACGPGNNAGDGFEAAAQLQGRGFAPVVTFCGREDRLPDDARASLHRAREAGVAFAEEPPATCDLAIDALLGIGAGRPPEGAMADWLRRMHAGAAPVLSVDIPSGLNADTGAMAMASTPRMQAAGRRSCLSLLTLKPGLFTAQGRDEAGDVWFDDLGAGRSGEAPIARLAGTPAGRPRAHASHKGTYGDVAVIGGAPGMAGAALLAATAALHAGAGRVLVGLLDPAALSLDTAQPELMLRDPESLDGQDMTVVCGCGGGSAIGASLPRLLSTARHLVIDADALNAIALDASLQTLLEARGRREQPTVLTPHPLEAARLLGIDAQRVQGDRLGAAQALATRFGSVVVLKGSGTVVAEHGSPPSINLGGNARLASAGTGDVLAGMIGAALSGGLPAVEAARQGVSHHGRLADDWPAAVPLTAGALARGSVPPAPGR